MSKSLKNFISIREALEKYTMVQIRIMFLSHNWDSTLDFKESSLQDAKDFENRLNNFFTNVKAEINRLDQQPPEFTGKHDFGHAEKALSDLYVFGCSTGGCQLLITFSFTLKFASETSLYSYRTL